MKSLDIKVFLGIKMVKSNFFENIRPVPYDELTFSLEELTRKFLKTLDFSDAIEVMSNPVETYQNFIRPKEREKFMKSSFLTSSSDVVEFLEKSLGLELYREFNNHRRNQLNVMIRGIAETHRGKKTLLDYYQFRNLIMRDDFNKFVLNNFDASKAKSEEQAYREIMYLQQNKFKETQLYQEQKQEDSVAVAYALSLVDGFAEFLRSRYSLYVRLVENEIFYGDTNLPNAEKELLEIISYRQRQNSPAVYKFDSEDDVNSTNDEQIIKWFLSDVDAWVNEDLNHNSVG